MVVMFVYIFHEITATKVVYFSEISYHKTGQCTLVVWCLGQILSFGLLVGDVRRCTQ
jgi:hypothetical protein